MLLVTTDNLRSLIHYSNIMAVQYPKLIKDNRVNQYRNWLGYVIWNEQYVMVNLGSFYTLSPITSHQWQGFFAL